MLSKFETKSNRVKGLSFHPKRAWVIASLHSGSLQLWDYKMGTMVDRFDEHEGPVRAVSFHPTQPLFVSGGDDYKIKVWNWKLRKCLFTLNGHIDYIRTVFFHHELPWIISCSDDQTIKIWNWQSRTCISTLTGHNHYVMSAQFHHKEDLIVSASLDQTARVWDISNLRKKHAAGTIPSPMEQDPNRQLDAFGQTDVVVKHVLEGHDRGVNWAAFHPTLPMIVTGADDRQVKLWRMSETKAWEVDTCRGHYNNISSVIFHPRQDLIVSCSEDKTIRVWDMGKRTALQTFRREHDRYWVIAAHPELNLFAAGHDGGLVVFKLERERPAHALSQNTLFYVKDKSIRVYDCNSSNDAPILNIRRPAGLSTAPRSMSYNPAEHSVLLTNNAEGGSYELHSLPKDIHGEPRESSDPKRGSANSAVFIGRNRFAVFVKSTQEILIKDLSNEVKKKIKPPTNINDIFYAGSKNLILTTPTSVILFDTETRATLGELNINAVRYVVWSADMNMVALISKHNIAIANKNLVQSCLIHETIKIKSGVWDEAGIFVFSTLNHLKYVLPEGDCGIIKTLDQPVYITRVKGKAVHSLDRDGKTRVISIDPTEYKFKLALVRRNYEEVLHIIRTSNLVGQSIIAYLQKKGYPELALHFVKDPKTRFDLALECGNMEVAVEMAKTMDREECWAKLGSEALKQGNHQILEMCYQRAKQFDKLSFLYLITGNVDKLKKMLKIAELRNDVMSRYHNAIYVGDVEEQIQVLKDVGQAPLAYLMAQTHGLTEEAESILIANGLDQHPQLPAGGELLKTPTPIIRDFDGSWPTLNINRSAFETGSFKAENTATAAAVVLDDDAFADADAGDWGADDIGIEEITGPKKSKNTPMNGDDDDLGDLDGGEEGGWDLGLDDIDLPGGPADSHAPSKSAASVVFSAPTPGQAVSEYWIRNSAHVSDHAAAGSFETAMQLLSRQIGVVNFAPLKPYFMTVFQASRAYLSCNSGVPPLELLINRGWQEDVKKALPHSPLNLSHVISKLQEGYQVTTTGKFNESLLIFKNILFQIIFTIAGKRQELDEIEQLLTVAREYIVGLKMELARKEILESDPKRAVELAAYFTHCQLQPAHLQLSLRSAMLLAYKIKNFGLAILFAKRLLELGPAPQVALQAKKLLGLCEQNPVDEVKINYDQYNPFVICAQTFVPIYRGSPVVKCPYCSASYVPACDGQLCNVCGISKIGATGTGLRNAAGNL